MHESKGFYFFSFFTMKADIIILILHTLFVGYLGSNSSLHLDMILVIDEKSIDLNICHVIITYSQQNIHYNNNNNNNNLDPLCYQFHFS